MIGHGRWVPGGVVMGPGGRMVGRTANGSPVLPTRFSRGFGQAESPGALWIHPSDHRFATEIERSERADRASMWREMSGSVRKRLQSAHTYDALVMLATTSDNAELIEHLAQIDKDLPRTFPENPLFRESKETMLGLHEGDGSHGTLLEPLRRVLSAYCVRNPSVGYCQAMNFVAGTLLMVLEEDDAFWVLCCIIEDEVEGYYTKHMTALRTDLRTLEKVTVATHPQIYAHLQKLGLPLELAAMRWLLSLFTSVFNQAMVVEILDELFTAGRKVLFQVAVGFMTHIQDQLLQCQEAEEALNVLNAKSMTSTGFLSRFKFSHYQLAGLAEIRASVETQIKIEQAPLTPSGMQPIPAHYPPPPPPPPPVGDYTMRVQVVRGANLPSIGTGLPNSYVCASVMRLGQFLPPEQHLEMSPTLVTVTDVQECSNQPTWNAEMQFQANGDVRNLVLTVFHKDMYGDGRDEPLGQVNIGLQKDISIREQWYRLQDRADQEVYGADGRHSLIQLSMSYSLSVAENNGAGCDFGGRVQSPSPIIVKAMPSQVTRRAAPQTRTSPQPAPAVSLYNDSGASSVKIEVTLDMDYGTAAAVGESFKVEVSNDLARAVRGFPDKVHIINFRQGSVIVDVDLCEGLCPDGRSAQEALESLQSQVDDPHSLLKQGIFTRHVLRISKANEGGHDTHSSSDTGDDFMDIPLQIDRDSPTYMPDQDLQAEPSPVQLRKLTPVQLALAMTPTPPQTITPIQIVTMHSPSGQTASGFMEDPASQIPDHYHPEHLVQTRAAETPRLRSSTAPTSPPLLSDPQHDPRQAYPNPFMYPIHRGLVSGPAHKEHSQRSPVPVPLPQHRQAQLQAQPQHAPPFPAGPRWLPDTWLGRYWHRRNQQKNFKRMQREEAMQQLRQQNVSRVPQTRNGRAGMVSHLRTMFSPGKSAQSQPIAIHPGVPAGSPQQLMQAGPYQNGEHVIAPLVPRLKELRQQPSPGQLHQHPQPQQQQPWQERRHDGADDQQSAQPHQEAATHYGAPAEYGSPDRLRVMAEDPYDQSERRQGQERVADWLGGSDPTLHKERLQETRPGRTYTMPSPSPMEPTILDVYSGTGTVRFHPAVNNYYGGGNPSGKRYESMSGYNTPTRGYGTLSPVALSAMTAPTPRVNSSMWSSMEMAIGDIPHQVPAFPHGYDPSKPYLRGGPPKGAYSLQPQEVYGGAVVNPQESISQYVQNRGGDVVIQPSRQPVRVLRTEFGEFTSSGGVIGGNPDEPVYFPRLPDKAEFNISVESIDVDWMLKRKLDAQARFISQDVPHHITEAHHAIAQFDRVRQKSAALLGSGPAPPEPDDYAFNRTWNDWDSQDMTELM